MRLVLDSMSQVMAMAAIVATLMYLPVGAIGLLVWWTLGLVAALPYAAGSRHVK